MFRLFLLLFLFTCFKSYSQNENKKHDSAINLVDSTAKNQKDTPLAKIEYVENKDALRQFKDEADLISRKEKRRTYIRYAFLVVILGTVIFISYSSYKKKKNLS